MNVIVSLLLFSLSMFYPTPSISQKLSPNAPPDKPVQATNAQVQEFEEAIAPYVKKAKQTLPKAKKKFQKGLHAGEVFFVTTRIYETSKFEQVFIKVNSWDRDTIRGILASDVSLLPTHKKGEEISCKESEVIDWTISKPDGSEEGNFVGKFLDTYKPR